MMKLGTSDFADWRTGVLAHAWYISPKGMCAVSRDRFKFWEISDIISLTVQDRDVVVL